MIRIPAWAQRPLVLALLVALVQTAALAAMIIDRARLLATGREIVLPVVPVDPRSLFRGDYVILSYPISRVTAPAGPPLADGATIFVTLGRAPDANGQAQWSAVAASAERPASVAAENVVLAGRVVLHRVWTAGGPSQVLVHYGIESYFVPEGTGKVLEDKVRTNELAAIVAVDRRGRSAIKGLVLDGQVRYDEPLF